MNATGPEGDLARAIVARGEGLASEHRRQGEQDRKRLLDGCAEKLRLLEEREVLSAKERAEREFRRLVQSSELRMQADLDRLRWTLVQSVTSDVRLALAAHAGDDAAYPRSFERLLAEAAGAIDAPALVAEVNANDRRRFAPRWEGLASAAAPGRAITLSDRTLECSGGVRVSSSDGRVRVDNTFEGRLDRLEDAMLQEILARLFPTPMQMEAVFNG